jgi:signal transduction histidine kinase
MPIRRATVTVARVRASRAVLIDVVVAVVALAVSATVLHAARAGAGLRPPDAAAYLLLGVYSTAVVLRRFAPAIAVVVGLAAGVAYAAAAYPAALTPALLLPVYSAAAALPERRSRGVLAVAVVFGFFGATLAPGSTDLGVPIAIVAAWLLGNDTGRRREYTAELERKNAELEQAQVELARRAVTEERLRIARELHDVVAHSMSVVAVHAGTGRMVADRNPAAAHDALATIEMAARSSLVEMRRLLGVLRSPTGSPAEDDGRAPAPGLADLDALVDDVAASGLAVEVCIDGVRPAVPAGVDLSAYRIVQEALTNVLRHAGRARVTVAVQYAADAVTVDVQDDGEGASATPRPPADRGAVGHGLVGMRERVELYHGDLEVGPRPGGGFRVRARLPYAATP